METLGLSSLCLSVLLEQDGSQSSFTSHLQSGHLPPSFLFLRMTSAHALFGLRPALREGAARAATALCPLWGGLARRRLDMVASLSSGLVAQLVRARA